MAKKRPPVAWDAFARDLGANIQRLRLERGLTQEQLAYTSGLSRYTFQKFEKGESMPGTPANPSLANIMAIAQVLGVTLDELVPRPWPDLRADQVPRFDTD
ncbi:XRE family transcriptional regulator [Aeromicrobium phragmitis]|uniref:XRE family transcriptional regulator n=2 Tax=Aeromicrobium TaxID=2040 RepID=A0A3N6W2E5_9ACTN|nr:MULTISPECIES: helix-turn-helix transcriptional regulator [Aeromicrobium]RLV52101.1 XRE family transcriptional regulator [Aeromicrobium phragmitis]RQN01660.1 XRE family transcriptional regulator [Aeromicrobium camelliae]